MQQMMQMKRHAGQIVCHSYLLQKEALLFLIILDLELGLMQGQ